MIHILVVEDDAAMNQIVCTTLNDNGYEAKSCLRASDAYEAMYSCTYDLIISDIMMPGVDGFEFAESVRKINHTIPILFMTALDDIASKKKGFDIGIDDYMVKPINMEELVLRVSALLRRANIANEKNLVIGNFSMNSEFNTATLNGEEIPLTIREFNILFKLLSYPNKTFSRGQLMDEFWDVDSDATLRAVDMYIAKLRDKLTECDGFKLTTVRGLGYKAVLT